MNIPKILTPKAMTAYIGADDTVRQGLEVMRRHGYNRHPRPGRARRIHRLHHGRRLPPAHSLHRQHLDEGAGAVSHRRAGEAGFLPAARHRRRRRRGHRRGFAAELRPDSRRPRLLLRHSHAPERNRRPRQRRGRAYRQSHITTSLPASAGRLSLCRRPKQGVGALLFFPQEKHHRLSLFFIVQTDAHIFLNDRQLKFDGF